MLKNHRLLLTCCMLAACALPLAAPAAATASVDWQPFSFETYAGKTVEAESATLEVPENRSDPESATIELTFVRLPTTAAKPAAPIVYLTGGPGSSAINTARIPSYLAAFQKLRSVADVILLDQRGTGRSDRGLYCPPPEGELPPLDSLANLPALHSLALERARRCRTTLAERGIDLAGYTTLESADDLDALRQALGAERISLLGFSYGTHLGLSAIRRHGERLERVALIGIEGPDHTRKLPSTLDTQVRKLSALAADDPAVNRQVPDMYALLEKVLADLEREPLEVPLELPDGTEAMLPVGPDGLRLILNWDLGDGNDFPVFPALLYTIDQRDPSMLAWFVRKRAPALAAGVPAMHYAVDGASGASAERWQRIEREAPDAILGDVANGLYPELPDALGVEPLGEDFRAPIVSDVETLFLSGTLDSNCPPYQAEQVRWGFTQSTHLIVANAGHEDMLGHPDVTKALVDFFRGKDLSERRLALPTPKFLSIADAKADRSVE